MALADLDLMVLLYIEKPSLPSLMARANALSIRCFWLVEQDQARACFLLVPWTTAVWMVSSEACRSAKKLFLVAIGRFLNQMVPGGEFYNKSGE